MFDLFMTINLPHDPTTNISTTIGLVVLPPQTPIPTIDEDNSSPSRMHVDIPSDEQIEETQTIEI